MIMYRGKLITAHEAAGQIAILEEALRDAQRALDRVYDSLDGEERKVVSIQADIKALQTDMKSFDLTDALPTPLYLAGFHLTELHQKTGTVTVLEDGTGSEVKTWQGEPSLSDLFEVAPGAR